MKSIWVCKGFPGLIPLSPGSFPNYRCQFVDKESEVQEGSVVCPRELKMQILRHDLWPPFPELILLICSSGSSVEFFWKCSFLGFTPIPPRRRLGNPSFCLLLYIFSSQEFLRNSPWEPCKSPGWVQVMPDDGLRLKKKAKESAEKTLFGPGGKVGRCTCTWSALSPHCQQGHCGAPLYLSWVCFF